MRRRDADYYVVYYGIRRPTTPQDVEKLKGDPASYLCAAEQIGLDFRSDCSLSHGYEEHYLFLGREIGIFGTKNRYARYLSQTELLELMADTKRKLKMLGIDEGPALHTQYFPDW